MSNRRTIYQDWIAELGRDPDQMTDPKPSKARTAAVSRIERAVRKALSDLTSLEREIIERYYFFGQSYAEIAAAIGKYPKRVEGKHNQALAKLRKSLASFVHKEFGLEISRPVGCPLCQSPFRKEIDRLIDSRRENQTWRSIMGTLKQNYNIAVKSPQMLIGHQKYHAEED